MKYKKIWFLPAVAVGFIALPATLAASCGSDSSSDTTAVLPQNFKWNNTAFKNGEEVKSWAEKNTQEAKIKQDKFGQYWELYAKNIRIGFSAPLDAQRFVAENNVIIKKGYFSEETINPKNANSAVEIISTNGGKYEYTVVKKDYKLKDQESAVVKIYEGVDGKMFPTEASAIASFTSGTHTSASGRFVFKEDATKYSVLRDVPYLIGGGFTSSNTQAPTDVYEATSFEGKKNIFTTHGDEVSWLLDENKFSKLTANDSDTWLELTYQFSDKASAGKEIKLHFWSVNDLVSFVVNYAKK